MAKKTSVTRATIQLYFQTTMLHRATAALALLNPLAQLLMNVALPFFAGKALASIAGHNGKFNHYLLLLAISGLAALLANVVGFSNVMKIQAKTMHELNVMVFNRLLQRGSSFHNNQISGKLISDALDFVNSYLSLSGALYVTGLPFLCNLLVGLIVVTTQSWQLGAYVLFMVGITLVWAYLESRTRHNLRQARLKATKQVTAHLSDTIVNAQAVKAFAHEPEEIATNEALSQQLRSLRLKDWTRSARSGTKRLSLLVLALFILLLLINHLSETNPNTLGIGIFAFTYTFTLMIRLFDINNLTRQVEEAFLQASPIVQILEEPNEIIDVANAPSLKVTSGAITLKDLSFHYQDSSNDQLVFTHFNLAIQPGERVGLVGPSGGGKSTLTRLLLRFENVVNGTIAIDGQNIAEVTQNSLRTNIAYVPQEPLLFHRSIGENISYGKPGATQQEIIDAAEKAYALDFIKSLPKGFDTIVGERGVKLSGGQRQRIAIARAILKNAPILLLDEATSALDSESEVVIQKALWELMQNRTTIVIAHRLSTIQKMDRIVVLDEGKIVEEGSHHRLLEKKGLYARLWKHQSGGFLEE